MDSDIFAQCQLRNVYMQGSEVHILHYLQNCFIRTTPPLSAFYAVLRLMSSSPLYARYVCTPNSQLVCVAKLYIQNIDANV